MLKVHLDVSSKKQTMVLCGMDYGRRTKDIAKVTCANCFKRHIADELVNGKISPAKAYKLIENFGRK